MAAGSVARRYARALFDLAKEAMVIDQVGTGLMAVAHSLREQANLRRLWEAEDVALETKLAFVQNQFGSIPELVRNFLGVVTTKRREAFLFAMIEAYQSLADEAAGRVSVEVRTAVPMGDEVSEQLRQRLNAILKKQVKIESRVDPSLMGGMVVRIGDVLMDGSVRTRLKRMRQHLVQAQANATA